MCQPKSKGGRRCPAHMAATRSAKTLAGQVSGLDVGQLTTAFNELREEGSQTPDPSAQQYATYLQRQLDYIDRSPMETSERLKARKLITTAATENMPDGATFYALRKLNSRSRSQSRALRREIANLAPQMGMTRPQALRQFWNAYHNSAPAGVAGSGAPVGYESSQNISAAAHGLPRDEATNRAYSSLRRAANGPEANPNISTERRVERQSVDSSFISEVGYDSEDGRLEVVFSRDPEQVYAYRNVPASTWEEMNTPGASVGSIYSRQVRRNPDHAYGSHEDAEADAYRRRCGYCGQFRASSHVCPESQGEIPEPRVAEPIISTPEPAPEPDITVSEDTHLPTHAEAMNPRFSIHALESETEDEEASLSDEDEVTFEPEVEVGRNTRLSNDAPEPDDREDEVPAPAALAPEILPSDESPEPDDADESPEPDDAAPVAPTRRARAPRQTAAERRLSAPYEDREVTDLRGVSSRYSYIRSADLAALGDEVSVQNGDYIYIPSPSRLRSAVNRGNVATISPTWNGYRDSEANYSDRHFSVTGGANIYREGSEWKARFDNEPRCTCRAYRENSHCEHVDQYKAQIGTLANYLADRTSFNARQAVAATAAGETPTINVPAASRRTRADRITNQNLPDVTGFPHDAYDNVEISAASDVRSALAIGNAVVPVSWSGYRRGEHSGRFGVSGDITLGRQEDGSVGLVSRNLRCQCADYRANYRCAHVDYVANQSSRIADRASTSTASAGVSHQEIEAAQARDWTRNEETRQNLEQRRAQANPEDMYSSNFESFNTDYNAARQRIADGENPITFMREDATGGLLSPESGRGFGVELEFDVSGVPNKAEALRKIGEELHAAGLTSTSSQLAYGSAGRNGYDTWSFERDCTVDAELVSPILSDTPENWAQVEKACEIIRRNGGKATPRTGSHVHVSTGSYGQDVQKHGELLRMTQQHEDTLYRLATNPETGKHRPMRWCAPNTSFNDRTVTSAQESVSRGGYYASSAIRGMSNGHHLGINFQSAGSGNAVKDNVEFRQWDGTLDPAAIQAQVKISAAMVVAAERNVDQHGPSVTTREPVGSRLTRQRAVLGRSRRQLTSEELEESTSTARTFIDTLFTRREDKAQITSLFAATKWQKG